jgi:hypothetical protein
LPRAEISHTAASTVISFDLYSSVQRAPLQMLAYEWIDSTL